MLSTSGMKNCGKSGNILEQMKQLFKIADAGSGKVGKGRKKNVW